MKLYHYTQTDVLYTVSGQNYIKKLRRENEQLKREIWNLREEYERLENYIKSREQSENEEVILIIFIILISENK
jgi:cell division protein FtsB